jgi:hypothetical protein
MRSLLDARGLMSLKDGLQDAEVLSRDDIDEPLVYYSWMVDAPPDWPRLGQLGW